jgi:hypothetical protein
LIKTLGNVAMTCYSHLSDEEREQIGLAKAVGIRSARLPKRSAGQSRRSRANSCRAGAIRRFTPPDGV